MPSPGPTDVLIRASTVGICGSDIELYQGKRPPDISRYPVIPGHEWSGTVATLGEQVKELEVGNKVVAGGFLACSICRNCREGLTNLCESGYDEIGFTQPGGLAEYVIVPARQVHVLPATAALDAAALLEPTAVVAHAFLRAAPRPGEVVVILGDGTISQLAVQLARLYSPSAIAVLGMRDSRLALSRSLGATHTLNLSAGSPLELVNELTQGRGADLVFEGAGHVQAVAEAFRLARRGGIILLEGIAGGNATLALEADSFTLKQLSVHGIFGANSRAWEYAVSLFRSGQLDLSQLITHRFPLERYEEALATLASPEIETLKVVIEHTKK